MRFAGKSNGAWMRNQRLPARGTQRSCRAVVALPGAVLRGFDRLPDDVTAPLEQGLVRSFEPRELRRALSVVADALLQEVRETDPGLAHRLAGPLSAACG